MIDNETPTERVAYHLANGPETWTVIKAGPTSWQVIDHQGSAITAEKTKKAATAACVSGFHFDLWQKNTRWYAGERVNGWKMWAECKAEQERNAARWSK